MPKFRWGFLSETQTDEVIDRVIGSLFPEGDKNATLRTDLGAEMPRKVVRALLRIGLTSDPETTKYAFREIEKIYDLMHVTMPDGDRPMDDGEITTFERARDGESIWTLFDVLDRASVDEITKVYEATKAARAAREHYENRRKEANAAIASKSLRARVFERHGEACLKCGESSNLCIDHILPVALGGHDDIDNLQVLCRSCNSSKGSNLEVQVRTNGVPKKGTPAYEQLMRPITKLPSRPTPESWDQKVEQFSPFSEATDAGESAYSKAKTP